MGYYVHISVIMACDNNDPLAEVAKRHMGKVSDSKEAEWYLEDLSTRKGSNPGPKGGLSMWGMVGNYTNSDNFVETLRPFWLDVYQSKAALLDFEHIIVFCEQEQSEQATCYEISYDEKTGKLDIKQHSLPFAWMQF